jgi:hypothetical protein
LDSWPYTETGTDAKYLLKMYVGCVQFVYWCKETRRGRGVPVLPRNMPPPSPVAHPLTTGGTSTGSLILSLSGQPPPAVLQLPVPPATPFLRISSNEFHRLHISENLAVVRQLCSRWHHRGWRWCWQGRAPCRTCDDRLRVIMLERRKEAPSSSTGAKTATGRSGIKSLR